MTKAYAAWPSSFSRSSPEAIRTLLARAPFFGRHTTEERLWNFAHPEECTQQRRIRSYIDGPIYETTGYAKLKLHECSSTTGSSSSSSSSSSSTSTPKLPPFETVALNKTLCVSSQAGGCAMGCTFCATGDLVVRRSNNKVNRLNNEDNDPDGEDLDQTKRGLIGDLDPGALSSSSSSSSSPSSLMGVTNLPSWAILEQLFWAHYCGFAIEKVVFMGMGEPLLNYANVVTALKVLSEDLGIKCALSTVGVAPRIRQLASDVPSCKLSLSLHATNPATRAKLLPIASKRWDLDAVLAAVRYHEEATGLAAVLEYTVIQGVNDSPEDTAKGLKDLIQQHGLKSSVNMIPYNPTNIGTRHGFASPTDVEIKNLRDAVRDQGIPCTVRFSTKEGRPIDAACGQLGNQWRKGVNAPPRRLEFR